MAKRFKKGSIEAKRFMAKIRLKKGKPKATKNIPDRKYKKINLEFSPIKKIGALAPINKSEQTLSFVPKTITENQILKEINKVKEEILHLLNMQKEHILKGHKRSLGALVKNKQKEIGNLLKKCK